MNYLYGSIAILIALLGIEQYGEYRVQTKWNIETARLQAIAEQEKRQDKEINAILEAKHLKDIENAKSEAGKSAVREYICTHGMLSHTTSNSQTDCSKIPNESTSESGIGGSIEEFAVRCAQDSMTILEFQEWAIRENLPIGD
jgi:protein required for attachment to host cells